MADGEASRAAGAHSASGAPHEAAQARVDDARLERAVAELLAALGHGGTADRARLARTPRRVAEHLTSATRGSGVDLTALVREGVLTDLAPRVPGDPIAVTGLRFAGLCEHHLLLFRGTATVAFVPGAHLIGLSRIGDLVEAAAARLTLQERIGDDVADALMAGADAAGVAVVLEGEHECARRRPGQRESAMITATTRGSLASAGARAEALALHTASTRPQRAEPRGADGRGGIAEAVEWNSEAQPPAAAPASAPVKTRTAAEATASAQAGSGAVPAVATGEER